MKNGYLSSLREAPNPDGTPGPFSFRRCAAAYLFGLAPFVLVASALLASKVLPATASPWAWIAVIVGPFALCLVVGLVLPILTTAESIRSLIAVAMGKGTTPPAANTAASPGAAEGL